MNTRFVKGDKVGAANATLRVPRPGLSDLVATFALAVTAAAVGFGADFNPVAARPGARLAAFKAEVGPIPLWSSVPSARRFTVAANTAAAFNTAAQAAMNATGGTRLLILPDFFNARVQLDFHNADQSSYVIAVPQRVVDGAYVLARGLRPNLESPTPWIAPDWVPRLEAISNGGTALAAVVRMGQNTSANRLMVYGCDIRVPVAVPGDYYCFNLIDFGGEQGRPADPTVVPKNLCLSHCWMGGHRFDAAGNWRTGNVGRGITDCGSGFAALDFWVSEHGSTGSQGSDRGVWGGGWSQGPVWIQNFGTDGSCGGIAWMMGGSDVPDTFPNCEDMEVAFCHVRWTDDYCYDYNDGYLNESQYCTLLDASGKKCPWQRKNQCEIKAGNRHWYHHNVLDGHTPGVSTQNYAAILKSVNQEGNGRKKSTSDVTFSHNIIRGKRAGGLGIVSSQVPSNSGSLATVDGIQRLTIYGNHLSGPGNLIGIGTERANTARPAANWQIVRNVLAPKLGGGANAALMAKWGVGAPGDVQGILECWGNVDVAQATYPALGYNGDYSGVGFQRLFGRRTADTNAGTMDLNAVPAPPALLFRDHHTLSAANGADGTFASGIVRYASLTAMGLARNATTGLYAQTAPTLNTAGANASSVGPDWVLLNAVVAAVTSGDVRSLLA